MANIPIGGQLDFPYQIANVDKRFGPYASVAAAYEVLGPEGDDVITAGLPFGITEADGSTTWCIWTKTGGEVTDYKRISHMQVVPFAGVVTTSVTIAQIGGLSQDGSTIKYLAAHNTFGYQSGTSYVTTWQNDYIWIDGDTRAPYKDILYVDKVNGSAYFYNGTALTELTPRVTIPVTSVNGKTGAVVLNKSDIGLGNVDNTSDVNKPISTATQTALDAKANASDLTSHTGNTNNPHQVTKAQVGLGNVDNTADAEKNVNSAVKDGSGNTITETYETKTDAATAHANLQSQLTSLANVAANLTGLEGTNFGGFSIESTEADAVSGIATLFTNSGYTVGDPHWFLAGTSMASLKAYRYTGTGTPDLISSNTYDFTDFSGIQTKVSSYKGNTNDLDSLNTQASVGIYHFISGSRMGLVSVSYSTAHSAVTQIWLSDVTPDETDQTLWNKGPAVLMRTYENGAWSSWKNPILENTKRIDELGLELEGVEKYLAVDERQPEESEITQVTGAMRQDGTIDSTATTYTTVKTFLLPGENLELNDGGLVYLGNNVAAFFLTDANGNLQTILHSRTIDVVSRIVIRYKNDSDNTVYVGWSVEKASSKYKIFTYDRAVSEKALQGLEELIGGKASDGEVVKVVEQSLTAGQKAQALANLGIESENEPQKDSQKLITSGGVEKYLARAAQDIVTGGGVSNTAMRITNGVVSVWTGSGYRAYGLNNTPKALKLKAGDVVTTPNIYSPTWLSIITKVVNNNDNVSYECLLQGEGGTRSYTYRVTEDVDAIISTSGSSTIHIERLEEAAPKTVAEEVASMSSTVSSINTRVTTLENNSNTSNLGVFEYTKMYHHLNVEANGSTIPSQSLFDIAYAKALGFKVIEANLHRCSDGVYVTKHGGANGNLGNGLLFASGSNINADTLFSEVTSTQLRSDVTYDSPVVKYRGFIPTVTEFCKECARLDMIPYLRGCTTEILNEARKFLSDDHIIIEGPTTRGDFGGLMVVWSSERTPANILNMCNAKGHPFLFGWLSLGNDDALITEVAQMLHQNGYMFGACYLYQNNYQNALGKGIDIFSSTYHHINPFENGNKLNILSGNDSNLQLTDVTYDSTADVFNMSQDGTIIVNSSEIGAMLSKICIKLRYAGDIDLDVSGSHDGLIGYQSDGTNEIVVAVALQRVGNQIMRIKANSSTVIYNLKVFASII